MANDAWVTLLSTSQEKVPADKAIPVELANPAGFTKTELAPLVNDAEPPKAASLHPH